MPSILLVNEHSGAYCHACYDGNRPGVYYSIVTIIIHRRCTVSRGSSSTVFPVEGMMEEGGGGEEQCDESNPEKNAFLRMYGSR